ncbi:STAS domain-containing protein [Streptomyces sp. NPDC012888]|uniref:STAS domain-containing protein n=1 Tax=Streptomyces sp. NPDC012888 TaxID=3364855 RepID=UPI0036C3FAEC
MQDEPRSENPQVRVLPDRSGTQVVLLSGEVDADSVSEVARVLADGARAGRRRVVDISSLEFGDSALLHVLLRAHAAGPLVIAGPVPSGFGQILHVTGADTVLRLAPGLSSALDGFDG